MNGNHGRTDSETAGAGGLDLAAITRAASEEAGGVPPALLADYLPAVLDAAATGRRLTTAELAHYGRAGEEAAESGVALRGLVDLYLSATWRLWRELPDGSATMARSSGRAGTDAQGAQSGTAGSGPGAGGAGARAGGPAAGSAAALHSAGLAVLRAADDAVAAAAEGFERAHMSVARREEAERREFLEDLLSGRGGVGDLIVRGERLGLRLAGPHQVVVAGFGAARTAGARPARAPGPGAGGAADPRARRGAGPGAARTAGEGAAGRGPAGLAGMLGLEVDAAIAAAAAPSPSLVATRSGTLVVIVGASAGNEANRVARALVRVLGRGAERAPSWRVAIGRPYTGPSGVVRSYEEARDALEVAWRIGLHDPVASAADLLVYQVLLRDRAAITDLVRSLLAPLAGARGGAGPLLATLAAYFGRGGVAAAAARDLHLSVRAVTYRLARVAELTGRDPADPADALALRVAVIGAQLLDWPATDLDPG